MKLQSILALSIACIGFSGQANGMERALLENAAKQGNLALFLAILEQNPSYSQTDMKSMANGLVRAYLTGQLTPEQVAAFKAKAAKLRPTAPATPKQVQPAPRPVPAPTPAAKPAQTQVQRPAPVQAPTPAMGKLSPASRPIAKPAPAAPRPAQPKAVHAPAPARPTLPPLSPASRNQQECRICIEDKPASEFRTLDCGHKYCADCLQRIITIDLKEKTTTGIKCPHSDCAHKLTQQEVARITGNKQAQEFDEIQFKESLRKDPNMIPCPTTDCNFVTFKAAHDHGVVTCLECHKDFCLDCKAAHSSRVSCAHAREMQQVAGDQNQAERASNAWKQQHTKECPHCKTTIEKTEGCNHMTCRQCRYEFCWLCQSRWGTCRCPMYGGDAQPAQLMQPAPAAPHAGNIRAAQPAYVQITKYPMEIYM